MALVRHILYFKGKDVWSINPDTEILSAMKLLENHDIGVLVVLEGEKLVGIISERDIVRKMAKTGKVDLHEPVKDFMTTSVFFVEPSNSVDECMKLMTSRHIRHLPVMDKGKIIGVISINDLVKEIIADRESMIISLENYIAGQANQG